MTDIRYRLFPHEGVYTPFVFWDYYLLITRMTAVAVGLSDDTTVGNSNLSSRGPSAPNRCKEHYSLLGGTAIRQAVDPLLQEKNTFWVYDSRSSRGHLYYRVTRIYPVVEQGC